MANNKNDWCFTCNIVKHLSITIKALTVIHDELKKDACVEKDK